MFIEYLLCINNYIKEILDNRYQKNNSKVLNNNNDNDDDDLKYFIKDEY